MTDATNILALMRRTTSSCHVGRNNGRTNRRAYIADYFKGSSGQTTSISPEDCQSYNPGTLQVVAQGSDGWSLTDGTNQLLLLDTQSDANTMLGVAQQASMHCFIGRGNMRPDPLGFIAQYLAVSRGVRRRFQRSDPASAWLAMWEWASVRLREYVCEFVTG